MQIFCLKSGTYWVLLHETQPMKVIIDQKQVITCQRLHKSENFGLKTVFILLCVNYQIWKKLITAHIDLEYRLQLNSLST